MFHQCQNIVFLKNVVFSQWQIKSAYEDTFLQTKIQDFDYVAHVSQLNTQNLTSWSATHKKIFQWEI